jgi:hypothetical protein
MAEDRASSLFLDSSELEALTGYIRISDQRRWLADHGWKFAISGAGRPVVSRSYCERKLGDGDESDGPAWQPNVSSLRPGTLDAAGLNRG